MTKLELGPHAEALKAFAGIRYQYEGLSREVGDLLRTKLDIEKLNCSISMRVKEPDSLREKLTRKTYENPLAEITDLAGCRIVCEYESDILAIGSAIKSLFVVHEIIDKTHNLGVDKMGYHGWAYVISLGN